LLIIAICAILAYIGYKMYRQSHKSELAAARSDELAQNVDALTKEAQAASAAGVNPGILTPAVAAPPPPPPAGSTVVSVNEQTVNYTTPVPYAPPSY